MAARKGSWVQVILSLVCLFCCYSVIHAGIQRKVTTTLNYDCSDHPACSKGLNGSFANLVYVQAVGPEDTIHYAISTVGVPSVLVIKAPNTPTNTLHVDWDKLLADNATEFTDDSIYMTNKDSIQYQYAVVFTKLHEYNDTDDAADLTHYSTPNSTMWLTHSFTDFDWMDVSLLPGSKNAFVFNSTAWSNNKSEEDVSGENAQKEMPSLSFVFHVFPDEAREDDLPHLLYNENVTQFDFTLRKFTPSYPMSRFALEMAVFSDSKKKEDMSITETESIDDEFTPGVFRITNILSQASDQTSRMFVQWKPVCYQDEPRSHSVATSVQKYDLADITHVTSMVEKSIAYAHFGQNLLDMNSRATNISFGLSGDGTYTKTNYTSWTATIGYGQPPADQVSMLVIGIISAGLGLPVIIIIFGGIFICIRKQRNRGYSTLQDVSSSYPQVNS